MIRPSLRAHKAAFAFLALSAVFFSACSDNAQKPANTQPANPQPATTPPSSTPAVTPQPSPSPANGQNPASGQKRIAVLETTAGTIKFELLYSEAPKTAENFRLLAQQGAYNGTIFHRVISGFMIQGGDPTGTGMGGKTATGQPLPNEVNRSSPYYQGGYKRGLVAMANKGTPETGTSQFFIMHQNYPLQPAYTVFGRVIEGMDVVDKIAGAPTGDQDRPLSPVKMTKVYVQ